MAWDRRNIAAPLPPTSHDTGLRLSEEMSRPNGKDLTPTSEVEVKGETIIAVNSQQSQSRHFVQPSPLQLPDKRELVTKHHKGVYWPSPITMGVSFIIGTSMAIGHHFYYASLRGNTVGTVDDQQRALRFALLSLVL
jgi:hypothetical protein